MSEITSDTTVQVRAAWWKTIGPALITACVVFGPCNSPYRILFPVLTISLTNGSVSSKSVRANA